MKQYDREEGDLLDRARAGDPSAVPELFQHHERRLKLMVRARMNPRLRPRLDEDDVMQDAYLQAVRRLPRYLDNPRAPFFLWLRQIVSRCIQKTHRRHFGFKLRDARREVSLKLPTTPIADSICLAELLFGRITSPSHAAARKEKCHLLQLALSRMNDLDREILSLRHFEFLTNRETAFELGIEPSAASKRYLRALLRLERILAELGMGADQFESTEA